MRLVHLALVAAVVAGCGSRTDASELDRKDAASPAPTTTSTSPVPSGRYLLSAYRIIGGLDRVVLCAEDRDADVAYAVRLVSPSERPSPITLPPQWTVEGAYALRPARLCRDRAVPPDLARATGESGTIAFDQPFPRVLTVIDVTLEFAASWVPRTVALQGKNVPITD